MIMVSRYDDYLGLDAYDGGYDYGLGMSNRAVVAYERGLCPKSRITLDDLRASGWTETKSLALGLIRTYFWDSAEWHHSGGEYYNAVDFYDPRDLVQAWSALTETEREALRDKVRAAAKPKATPAVRVQGEWTVWAWDGRRNKKSGTRSFTGTLAKGWITIDGTNRRKKASGQWLSYSVVES
tara:strand:- start:572 stop:1117 length:546 start_codon:yes stop_codon:yes gene_type:complete